MWFSVDLLNILSELLVESTHFWPVFPFYTPEKHQKTEVFLVFLGGVKWKCWSEL